MRFFLFILAILFSTTHYAQEAAYMPNQVLVRFEPNTDIDLFWERFDMSTKRAMPLKTKRLIAPYMNIWKIEYNGNVAARDVTNLLLRKREVAVAQVNHRIYSRTTPNDPLFATQWQWQNIAAEQAWDVTTGGLTANGDTIVVAIIDDGTQLDHPDLAANIWHNHAEIPNNGIDDDGNGYIDDYNGWNVIGGNNNVNNGGHGISVAGMIGATGNDGNQGVGANWNIKLMTIVGGTAQEAEVIESYSYALAFRKKYNETNGAEGAFVVATNSSWGIDNGDPNDAPLWCAFYDSLGVNGILSCGATSNSAYDVDTGGDLPTACPSDYLVAVTATDVNDSRNFSAWGLNTIDVGAPGDNIYTTENGSGYGFTSGTSFASPLTAGVIALLYSAPCTDIAALSLTSPDVAALLVRDYLFDGVDQTAQLMAEIKTGGRINAQKSMQLLMGGCGACTPPFSINAADVTDVTAALSFTALNDGAYIFIRPSGVTNWDTLQNASSPYALATLQACTEYEIVMQSICADSLSDLSPIYTFKTDGCCELPSNFHVVNVTNDSTTFAWDNVLAATSFDLTYAPSPFDTWETVSTSYSTVTISNLAPCTPYQAKIRTLCNSGVLLDYGTSIDFQTKGCGACTDSVYCESNGGNEDEYINSVEIVGSFVNESGQNIDGYGFYDNFNISFLPLQTYDIIITPGYPGFSYSERVKAWVDFNQNGQFDADEVIVDPDFTITEATTFQFTIPPGATPGLTRMRVRLDFNTIEDSCGTFSFGEVEDYCVNLLSNDACIPPFGIEVSDVLDVSSMLHFSTLNGASANIYSRPVGTTSWDTVLNVNSPYLMTGLIACSNYEVVLETNCADTLSTLSPTFIVKTDGCCELPDSLAVSNITNNGALLSWDGVLAANSFDIIYAKEPYINWDTTTTSNISTPLLGLAKCTNYQAKIRTNCTGNTLSFSSPIAFKTTGCGACLDLFYCESKGGNSSEWIDSVSVEGIFDNPSGQSATGYSFYSDLGINFTQDNSYNMTITPGYSGTTYSEYLKVWIDFNQNGTFDLDEVIFEPATSINSATTLSFTIPDDAVPGLTRMRVLLDYSVIDEPCGDFTFGEVVDYCVNIKEEGYCLGPDSLIVDDIEYYSANMNWAVVDSSISYIVKHRKVGDDWEAVTTAGNSYQLDNLDECTEYEAQVRAVCANGLGTKTYNLFKTQCLTGINTPFGKNAFTVQPNPFSDEFEVIIHGFSAKDIQVRLFDLLGREIPVKAISNNDKMVIRPNSQMAAGIYMLALRNNENVGTIRVVKE